MVNHDGPLKFDKRNPCRRSKQHHLLISGFLISFYIFLTANTHLFQMK
jgi:hypothetical protein